MKNVQIKSIRWSLLLLLATAGTASAQFDSLETIDDPLDYCKIMIIDEVMVPAEEPGVIDQLNVREGFPVEKGALLATIDNTDALLTLTMATHEYEAAKMQAENTLSIQAAAKQEQVAKAELDASNEANDRFEDTVTETEIRRKRLQAERAGMQKELAEHERLVAKLDANVKGKQFERAKAALKRRQIVSRINGVVIDLLKHAGDWADPGETVMWIVRMDQLYVEGNINGTRYARHEVEGRPVDIEVQLTGGETEKFEGTIRYAGHIVESNEYTVRAVVNNRKVDGKWLLTPGLDAKMRLRDTPTSRFSNLPR